MRSELEILEVEKRIRSRVKKQMEKTQKEYYLNEQMRAIQKELGEKDEFKNEIQELEEKLRQKKMPAEAREKCEREIKKLKMMSPMSAEATVVRNYLDWFLALPWFEYTEDKLDIKEAERILEEDHYGLEKVKQRILEYLAVQTLVGQMKGPILCLVGPPGVGKTSLGKSIARATGRKFVRVSLGGVRDEAEIRGHRRTYIGALPGKVIQSMRKAGSGNPVLLLDEVDKMSTDFRGDPSSALLEVLDPEQNCTFNDHYLDCDYDLSKVMFITTANTLERIPRPLQDRMEIIRIPGYTETEKLNIAKRYLVQEAARGQRAQGGEHRVLRQGDPAASSATTRARPACATSSARSPRSAARSRSRWSRPIATRTSRSRPRAWPSTSARRSFRYGMAETEPQIGVATGLGVDRAGRRAARRRGDDRPGPRQADHHRPARRGDAGERAGGAVLRALARRRARPRRRTSTRRSTSTFTFPRARFPRTARRPESRWRRRWCRRCARVPVRNDLAMTGEITLRGRVLPIGGLKEKVLAAHRGGIKTVLIPKENDKDVEEIPAQMLKNITLIQVEHMDDVLAARAGAGGSGHVLQASSRPRLDYGVAAESKEELVDDDAEDERRSRPRPPTCPETRQRGTYRERSLPERLARARICEAARR